MNKRKWICRIAVLSAIFMMSFNLVSQRVFAETVKILRVGLVEKYADKDKIEIKNASIHLGYSVKDKFQTELTLYSSSGFRVLPTKDYYYRTKTSYTTYKKAEQAAEKMRKLGVSAWCGMNYRNTFGVYIGGTADQKKTVIQMEKVKKAQKTEFSELLSDNGHRMKLVGSGGSILIDVFGHNAYPQIESAASNTQGVFVIDLYDKQYRGRLEVGRFHSSYVTAVNVVELEQYLYGVVPAEMNDSWHMEALKAQAVCSRGLAAVKSEGTGDSNLKPAYVLGDTTASQVYKGYSAETRRTSSAVKATKGIMIYEKQTLAAPYYFSTSGGRTESMEAVWGGKADYLKSVPDIYESAPEKAPWVVSIPTSALQSLSAKRGLGEITQIMASKRHPSGRVASLELIGTSRRISMTGEEARNIFSLPGTKFKVVKYGDNPDNAVIQTAVGTVSKNLSDCEILSAKGRTKPGNAREQYIVIGRDNRTNYPTVTPREAGSFLIAGQGYGHGVGMSQSGANGMAEAGYSYKEILHHYYTGVTIK